MTTRLASGGCRLAVLVAAMVSVVLAAPAAAQDIRLTRPTPNLLDLAGGSPGAEWHMRYGTSPPSAQGAAARQLNVFRAAVHAAGPERAYFSHGGWLRLIDTQKGLVLGRWHFPCVIANVMPEGDRANVQMDCYDPPTPLLRVTRLFDPRSPELPPWAQGSLLALRLPGIESAPLLGENMRGPGCSANANTVVSSPALIENAEAAVRRDPFSPWLRLALGRLLRQQSDPRAAAVIDAAVSAGTGDFTEIFPLSSCLEALGDTAPARAAYERGYADFMRRGHDPRLVTILITRLMLYAPPFFSPLRLSVDQRDQLIERVYRLSPNAEGTDLAWRFHADALDRRGRRDEARTWRARAAESESSGLRLSTATRFRDLDRLLLAVQASVLAALALVVALFIKYLPQRRLVPPVPMRSLRLAPGFTTINIGFWSRRERITFVLIVLAGWLAAGVATAYSRVTMVEASAPIGPSMGTLASPTYQRYLTDQLAPTPERDLLTAMSAHANGDVAQAEALYRALPQFAEAWNNLGVILKISGRDRDAQDAFGQALRVDPSLGEASWNAGRGAPTFFTLAHQQYAPDRPMVAPPSRGQLSRAYLGVSGWGVALRALAGPFANTVYFRIGPGRGIFGADPIFELTGESNPVMNASVIALVVLMAIGVIALVVRARDVTQPSGRAFRVLEYVIPGLSPYWRHAAAPVLLAWALGVLFAVLLWTRDTPYWLTRMATLGLVRAYGIDVATTDVLAAAPSGLQVAVSLTALFIVNAVVVARSSRTKH
jgi:tetratricopeptide (TPR) repeat protein